MCWRLFKSPHLYQWWPSSSYTSRSSIVVYGCVTITGSSNNLRLFIVANHIHSIAASPRWYAKQLSEMENFSDQWLQSISYGRYASHFSAHGYSTFAKCSQLTEADLTTIGVTDERHRKGLLNFAERLQGRQEADIIREIPVSVLHAGLSIISCNAQP